MCQVQRGGQLRYRLPRPFAHYEKRSDCGAVHARLTHQRILHCVLDARGQGPEQVRISPIHGTKIILSHMTESQVSRPAGGGSPLAMRLGLPGGRMLAVGRWQHQPWARVIPCPVHVTDVSLIERYPSGALCVAMKVPNRGQIRVPGLVPAAGSARLPGWVTTIAWFRSASRVIAE
jgi:hypothetical protein